MIINEIIIIDNYFLIKIFIIIILKKCILALYFISYFIKTKELKSLKKKLIIFLGMECSFGNKNIISKVIDSCPGILDSNDKSYCCYDFENNEMYCCDAVEFASKSSW